MENEQDSDNELEMVKEKLGQGLLINKVPIHRGLKLPMKKALRIRKDIYPAEPEIVITECSQITEIESQPQLQEPGEKLTIIERAVGYFNAENDVEASKSTLNTSVVNGPPFSCIICKSWFYLGTKLKVHYILNHKMYHCEVCSLLFETYEDKETHLRNFHSQSFCEICQKNITNCYNLVEHYEYDHNSTACKFCGTLLQPKTMFVTHVLRKHCVNNKFLETPDVKFMDVLDNDTEFFCALCDKNRESEGFFGHMNSHHKISVTSLLNMMIKDRIEFKVDGAKLSDRKNGAKEEILPLSYKIKGSHRNTCSVCFIRFTKKMPSGFHAVYCQSRIHCKYCNTRFENVTLRDKHVEKRHNKFFCTLGCERLSFNSEENLNKHYLTYHEIISCRYCEVFISVNNGKYESHLMESHKYKAVIMKNFTDTLFEVTDQKDKHIVVCCLCDENITLLVETVRDIYDHYSIIHSVSAKRILQLVTPKPILAEYEDFYREINESIKKESQENETISSDETSDVHNNGRQDGGDETADQPDLSLNSIANIKIKMEPLDLLSEDENVQESSFDESKFETDFDYQELEGLLQYDSGSDDENEEDKSICEVCGQEEISLLDLMIHLKNDHKLKSQYCEYRCDYCSELFLNKMSYMNHLFSHQETSELDVSKDTLNCDCDSKVSVNLARSHILKSHLGDLDKYDVQQLGLKCRFCELRFWEYEEANEHEVKMHLEENEKAFLKCYKCLTIFSNQICLKQHTKQLHQDSIPYTNYIYKCLQCSVANPNIELSREHFHSVHPDSKIYLCPVPNCHKTCSHPKYIKIHLKTPHKSKAKVSAKPEPCDVCGKVSKSLRAASIHKLMKHNRDRAGFQCRICRERFNTNEQRKLHYATSHTGQLAYTCLECGKGFVSKSGLYGHKKIHEQATAQVCPYCSKEFIRRDSYNEHLLIHIGPRHQCPHCPKSFTQRSNLTRHVRIHTGVKPYSCMYCDKRFSDQGACRSHERVHTKEEHCECSYCGKKFSKRQKLKYHIKFHTGEGLMDCEVCGKQFTNSYSLTEHRKIHNQQTLVMCKCGRGFTSEKYLHRHMINVHSQGPARYFCPICYKPIYHRSAYNDHVMTHTSVKHVKCLLCNTEYNTRKTVRKHLLEKHNFKPTDDFSAHIYQLTPEEAGLNIPPVTELTDLLEDQNILKIDISQLQTMDAGSKSMSVKKKPRKDGAKLQIKEELVTDEEVEDDDESEDEVMLETRAKRKVKKPVKLRQKSEINTKNMKNDDEQEEDISEDVSREENV